MGDLGQMAHEAIIDSSRLVDIVTPVKAIAFDTLEFAKRLGQADFTEKQAETLAAAEAEIIDSRLATKEDLSLLQLSRHSLTPRKSTPAHTFS